jgi:hypothetical protein
MLGLGDDVAEFVSSVWASVLDGAAFDEDRLKERATHSLSLTDLPARQNETSL